MIAAKIAASALRIDRVDPGDGVLEGTLRLPVNVYELVERVKSYRLAVDQRARDRDQPKLDPRDEAGQAESADRGAKELAVLIARALPPRSVRPVELEPRDPGAECAPNMMVLAVDVIRHGAAKTDELCARRHGEKPAAGNGELRNGAKRRARLGAQDAG